MNRALLHPITEDEIRQYERDGAICIRGQFDRNWIDHMLDVTDAYMQAPTGRTNVVERDGDPGRFFISSFMWRTNAEFRNFAMNSPAAEIAARLMRQTEVRLYFDQIFAKVPKTRAPTQWHHDLPYWPFEGNHIASVWVALTPCTKETSGLVYVAGSHAWGKRYRAVTPGNIPNFGDERMEECPEFHKEFGNPAYRFLSWDMEAGDCIVHHPLAVHGSGANQSTTQRRVAVSVRYFGGDAVWAERTTKFAIPGIERPDHFAYGRMPADDALFPIVWRA